MHFFLLVTNPVDVIKIRLQLDNELSGSSAAQRKYKGFFRGIGRIVAEEGVRGLYKGFVSYLLVFMISS